VARTPRSWPSAKGKERLSQAVALGWPSVSCVFKRCKVTAALAKPSTKARSMALPIRATEITFDIGDKAIECLGRAIAAVELAARKQLRLGCLVRAATSLGFRVGNPSAIGWHQQRIFQHPCYP
jgi:hypothetical protein